MRPCAPGGTLAPPARHGAVLLHFRLYGCQRTTCKGAALVGLTGVEPVTSSLSGTRSNQLSYKPGWSGGGSRSRTGDLLLAKQPLHQLSYAPAGQERRGPGGGEAERCLGREMGRPGRTASTSDAPAGRPAPQKGGDPTAGSPTVTLLRLHPNHHPHLRPTNAGLRVQTAFMM